MIQAMRISVGNGQSHEDVRLVFPSEYSGLGIPAVFGDSTLAYFVKHELHLLNTRQVNVIQFGKSRTSTQSSVKFNRLVLDDDSIYGPGHIIPDHWDAGLPDNIVEIMRPYSPMIFSARDGLMMVKSVAVADLQLSAVVAPDGIIHASGS